jgi:hypothetical protein
MAGEKSTICSETNESIENKERTSHRGLGVYTIILSTQVLCHRLKENNWGTLQASRTLCSLATCPCFDRKRVIARVIQSSLYGSLASTATGLVSHYMSWHEAALMSVRTLIDQDMPLKAISRLSSHCDTLPAV